MKSSKDRASFNDVMTGIIMLWPLWLLVAITISFTLKG